MGSPIVSQCKSSQMPWDIPWDHVLPMGRPTWDVPWEDLWVQSIIAWEVPWGLSTPMRVTLGLPSAFPWEVTSRMGRPMVSPMGTNMHPMGSPRGLVTSRGKSHGPSLGLPMGCDKHHATSRRSPHRKQNASRGEHDRSHRTPHGLTCEVQWAPQCIPLEIPRDTISPTGRPMGS